MEWTTIDAVTPDTKASSMVAPDKRSGWTWGKDGSPDQRQATEQATINKEAEYRRIAKTIGEVGGTAAKDAADAKLNEAQSAAQYSIRSTWEAQKQNINLTLLVFGVIAVHGAVSWLRPIINTANSLNGFNPLDPRGILQLISNPMGNGGSNDPTPLKKGDRVGEFTVTSGYGNRTAPTAGASTFHRGIDLNTPVGTPIYAAYAGHVSCGQENGGYGQFFDAPWGMGGHLSECYPGYKQEGELIGLTGDTGISTGPHLDLREGDHPSFTNPTRGFTERVMGIQSAPVQLASFDTGQREQQAINYFLSQGFTPTATAYLVGSLKWESGFDPARSGDGGKALGLNQWWPDRRVGMPATFEGQLQWVIKDMQSDSMSKGVLQTMQTSNDAAAVKAAIEQWTRWGVLGDRWVYAEQILSNMQAPNAAPRSRTLDLLNRGGQRI